MPFDASTTLLAVVASVVLGSCTYLQPRFERRFEGVVLDERTERPVAGALVVLHETRFFDFHL